MSHVRSETPTVMLWEDHKSGEGRGHESKSIFDGSNVART